ncbi:hypothetical protein [Sphingomonas adhaesiva]|uniref:hypothetical protein n=1 Tax=Sphingomonas adhaesiva TaxID=28212 RepID=UPI002FF73082
MSDREAQRAADRERRAQERIAAAEARTARRQEEREAGMRLREQAREARRVEEDQRRTERVEERDARPKRRASTGALARTGEARVERDVRSYTTHVDHDRMVELARRGATVAGLATVFGVSEDAVRAVLDAAAEQSSAGD